jgi:hypothetical protein
MAPRPITPTDEFLSQISGQLETLIGILRPEPPAEPEPEPAPADDEPTAKKAPVKKPAARRRVTGQ